jgi:CheY-like chemotaxis protein
MPYIEQHLQAKLLIVDDEPLIRTAMMLTLSEIGFSVRSAEDGLTALAEIRNDVPDIILSDLHMPGMSGFEFLSVVRRRLPSIRVIAMSGAFSGEEVPSGVAADAFFPKGSGLRCLLKIVEGVGWPERLFANPPAPLEPLRIGRSRSDGAGEACVAIACPECLRTFQQSVVGSLSVVREAQCVHCHNVVYYTIVEPVESERARLLKDRRAMLNRTACPNCVIEITNKLVTLTTAGSAGLRACWFGGGGVQTNRPPGYWEPSLRSERIRSTSNSLRGAPNVLATIHFPVCLLLSIRGDGPSRCRLLDYSSCGSG